MERILDGVLAISVMPGVRGYTEAERRAYLDTLDWSDPLHLARWDGSKFTEMEVPNGLERTN